MIRNVLVGVVVVVPVIGMFVARAGIELLRDHTAVPPCLVRVRGRGDRPGRTQAEDGSYQKGAHHRGGPPPGQITARVPRHPNNATANLPHPLVSPPVG